ncbi:NUDIX hydrolase [Pelotomaculum propionicicum]|uniref:NUDIX hydrolase n=1 Tax=Pelotomaculum propionicicum TaxID=258475 RepID=UPI003B7B8771
MELVKNLLKTKSQEVQNIEEYFVSAVLLPLAETERGLEVLFEVRANHLRRQPGEICFPGGRVEKNELMNPEEAAIRETAEELGIQKDQVELLGSLNCFFGPPANIIYPYVGLIKDKESIKPEPAEVEEVFWAPLKHFIKNPPAESSVEVATRYARDFPFNRVPASYRKDWNKKWSFPVYFYEYGERFIWGITARILYHFVTNYNKISIHAVEAAPFEE